MEPSSVWKWAETKAKLPDILYYEQLKTNVIQHDLLVDSLIYKDVKLTASNDDYYFVFEDYLYQVLLCFSRDTSVLGHFAYNSASPPKSYIRGKLGLEEYAVFYPPNGKSNAIASSSGKEENYNLYNRNVTYSLSLNGYFIM